MSIPRWGWNKKGADELWKKKQENTCVDSERESRHKAFKIGRLWHDNQKKRSQIHERMMAGTPDHDPWLHGSVRQSTSLPDLIETAFPAARPPIGLTNGMCRTRSSHHPTTFFSIRRFSLSCYAIVSFRQLAPLRRRRGRGRSDLSSKKKFWRNEKQAWSAVLPRNPHPYIIFFCVVSLLCCNPQPGLVGRVLENVWTPGNAIDWSEGPEGSYTVSLILLWKQRKWHYCVLVIVRNRTK